MKRIFYTIILLIGIILSANGQNTTIEGQLTDAQNVPVFGANIYIKSLNKGVQSDMDGSFSITNLKSGTYLITISYLGYKSRDIKVDLSPNETKKLGTIVLYEGNELLQEIVLTGERKNKFSRKETAYVSKLPLKDIENPQVYSTVTTELLQSQVVTNFDDALKNATGVTKLWEATGRSGDGTGYYSIRGFNAQPTFVDGVPGFTFSAIDPSYIERIEVIKGPSATLFGIAAPSFGGLINVVTKKPYEGFGGNVSYTGGAFNTHRISADLNTPISENDGIYFRVNTSYLTQDSFQNQGFKETFFVAPSFSYRVNNRLSLSLGIEYSKTKQTNPAMIFVRRGYPMPSNTIEDFGLNVDESFTDNDIFLENPTFSTRFIADYKLSDNWTSQTIFASNYTQSKGYYQYVLEGAAVFLLNPNPQTPQQIGQNQLIQQYLGQNVLTRLVDQRDASATNFNFQQNFTGDFKIGKTRNRLLIGLDYFNTSATNNNRAVDPRTGLPFIYGYFAPDGTPLDDIFFTPTVVETEYPINRAILDPVFEQIPANDIKTDSQVFAAYVSDVIDFTPQLSAMVGLRLDHFDQDGEESDPNDGYTETRLSPKFGLLYQPIKDKLSAFVNYQTSYRNVDPAVSIVNGEVVVQTFDPERAEQFEFGFKSNFFKSRLNLGVNYYNITVENNGSLDPRNPFASIAIDEMVSQGVEFELNANPVGGLNIRASYAYNDSEITETDIDVLAGRRPEEAGPESIYNFWTDYRFPKDSFLKNFGIAAGFDGASKYYTMNNGVSGQFELPGYTILNASVYYNAEKFRVGIKANNITDEEYYKGWSTINPQMPFNMIGTISYKF